MLYGPVVTNTLFKGFGGACEQRVSGDAVVRYDQLADRWLFVLPVFQRGAVRPGQAALRARRDSRRSSVSPAKQTSLAPPYRSSCLRHPRLLRRRSRRVRATARTTPSDRRGAGAGTRCATRSAPASDPLGAYFRYEFLRPLFPDYPRPAVWPDGYYVPTSVSDDRISATVATRKHACVADRAKMLKGAPATEQCLVIDNVNFLNNADIDGTALPPRGAPNIMMAAGGTQLDEVLEDDRIFAWRVHVDWANPGRHRSPDRSRSASRRTGTCATDSSPTACRSRAPSSGSTRRATRSWRGSSTAGSTAASRSSRCTR